jgi:hypothetical protein
VADAGHTGAHRLQVKVEGHVGRNESAVQATDREHDFVLACFDWQLRRTESRSRLGCSSLTGEQGERGMEVTFVLQTDGRTRSATRLSVLFKGPICTRGHCPFSGRVFVLI